jgi:hypothetical protein
MLLQTASLPRTTSLLHCLMLLLPFLASCCFVAFVLLPFVSFRCFYFSLPFVALLFRATSHYFVASLPFVVFCYFYFLMPLVTSLLQATSHCLLPSSRTTFYLVAIAFQVPFDLLTFCICCFITLLPRALLPCCFGPCYLVVSHLAALLLCCFVLVGTSFLPSFL